MLEGLARAVDELVGVDISSLPDAAIVAEFRAVRREIDRLEHRAAALLVAAEGRGVPAGDGAASTPMWAQWQTGQRSGDALVSLTAGLACERLALVDKAWRQGEISASSARTIGAGRVDAYGDVYGEMEQTLVDYAAGHCWRDLYGVIRHYRAYVNALDEREPSDRNGLHHSKVLDRWASTGDWDDLSGHVLDTALHAAMGTAIEGDDRSPAKRRADALIDIAQFFLDHETLPLEAGEAPHLSVTIDWSTIMEGLPCGRTVPAYGPALSPAQLRTVLCDAKVSRILTGPDSEILDVGRAERTANRAMRRALAKRDRGCRYPGCDRRPNRCQAHHVWAWEHGGPTNLANLVLLCKYHHGVVHRTGWTNTFERGTYKIYRPDGTQLGQT